MPVAIGTKVRTGDICPITGIWRVPRVLGFGHPVVAGRVMPIYSGQDVVWELILIV